MPGRNRTVLNSQLAEQGFTLVEMVIIVSVIGIVAATALVYMGGLMGSGEGQASQQELDSIQTAVDTMMIKNRIASLPSIENTATNDMTRFPSIAYPLYPDYVRSPKSSGRYLCSTDGTVTEGSNATPVSPTATPFPLPWSGCG